LSCISFDHNGCDAPIEVELEALGQAAQYKQCEVGEQELWSDARADAQYAAMVLVAKAFCHLNKLRYPYAITNVAAAAAAAAGASP
jgi:hypothetical protein